MGYSQKEVARLLGHKDTTMLSRWEKGKSMPSARNLLKLSIIYRTLADQLYFDLILEERSAIDRNRRDRENCRGP